MKKMFNRIGFTLILSLFCIFIGSAVAERLSDETAVVAAKRAIMDTYGVTEEIFSMYKVEECIYRSDNNGNMEWFIIFAGDCGDLKYDNNTYAVYLTPEGNIKTIFEPIYANNLNEKFMELIRLKGMFVTWSLDDKYQFSQEWRVAVEEAERQRGSNEANLMGYLNYLIEKEYLLPDGNDISQEEATILADAEISRLLNSIDNLETIYNPCYSFLDVDGRRVWRVIYVPINRTSTDCGYRIDIDAGTGEIVESLHQISYESEWATYYE